MSEKKHVTPSDSTNSKEDWLDKLYDRITEGDPENSKSDWTFWVGFLFLGLLCLPIIIPFLPFIIIYQLIKKSSKNYG